MKPSLVSRDFVEEKKMCGVTVSGRMCCHFWVVVFFCCFVLGCSLLKKGKLWNKSIFFMCEKLLAFFKLQYVVVSFALWAPFVTVDRYPKYVIPHAQGDWILLLIMK